MQRLDIASTWSVSTVGTCCLASVESGNSEYEAESNSEVRIPHGPLRERVTKVWRIEARIGGVWETLTNEDATYRQRKSFQYVAGGQNGVQQAGSNPARTILYLFGVEQ